MLTCLYYSNSCKTKCSGLTLPYLVRSMAHLWFGFIAVCMGHVLEYTYSMAVQTRTVVHEAVLYLFGEQVTRLVLYVLRRVRWGSWSQVNAVDGRWEKVDLDLKKKKKVTATRKSFFPLWQYFRNSVFFYSVCQYQFKKNNKKKIFTVWHLISRH